MLARTYFLWKKPRKNVKVSPTALLVGIGDNDEAAGEAAAAAAVIIGVKRVEVAWVCGFFYTPFSIFTDSCRNFGGLLKS